MGFRELLFFKKLLLSDLFAGSALNLAYRYVVYRTCCKAYLYLLSLTLMLLLLFLLEIIWLIIFSFESYKKKLSFSANIASFFYISDELMMLL